MNSYLKTLNDSQIIKLYGKLITELKERKIIRTKNVIGDIGERIAIDYYTNTDGLDNLIDAKVSEKSIDARSQDNSNTYTIKSTTSRGTGVFHGLPNKDSDENPEKLFDFLLIVQFSNTYELIAIYELTWEQFLKYKKWHKTANAWTCPLNKAVKEDAKIILHCT